MTMKIKLKESILVSLVFLLLSNLSIASQNYPQIDSPQPQVSLLSNWTAIELQLQSRTFCSMSRVVFMWIQYSIEL